MKIQISRKNISKYLSGVSTKEINIVYALMSLEESNLKEKILIESESLDSKEKTEIEKVKVKFEEKRSSISKSLFEKKVLEIAKRNKIKVGAKAETKKVEVIDNNFSQKSFSNYQEKNLTSEKKVEQTFDQKNNQGFEKKSHDNFSRDKREKEFRSEKNMITTQRRNFQIHLTDQ